MLNEKALKKKFYQLSKQFHPDFYTLESEEKQAEILELSTINNDAYKTLSDFDKRMEYILKEKGVYAEEGQNKVPQDFLME
ncbi:MAG: DnaJ domain-containing protein [Saprospiraceae bacterium]|nr:DnaJ domain-containing protein [Saprospiraceae bacterium]